MIEEFVKRWEQDKGKVKERFRNERPDDYRDIVEAVVEVLNGGRRYEGKYGGWWGPDPEKVQELEFGHYKGDLIYILPAKAEHKIWYVVVRYGSCSGCDTFLEIQGWGDEISEKEVQGYMRLALHIVQNIREFDYNPELQDLSEA